MLFQKFGPTQLELDCLKILINLQEWQDTISRVSQLAYHDVLNVLLDRIPIYVPTTSPSVLLQCSNEI